MTVCAIVPPSRLSGVELLVTQELTGNCSRDLCASQLFKRAEYV